MAYDGRILRRAYQKFEEDRQQRQDRFQSRREAIFLRQPRLREIEGELRSTMSRIIASALRRGTDPLPAVEVLKEENLGLQEEKRRLLAQMGLPEDALEERPACPLCGDSGYRGGQVCRCLRKYYAREQQKELSRMLDLGGQSFETFSLNWYSDTYDPMLGISPRKNMAQILEICRSYAETFSQESGSLLLTGDPGLGKTFLSACIARTVSESGFSVVYDTAGNIFAQFELKKFQREQGTTYLFIAHDLSIVRFISDRIGVIYKGDIVEVAEAEELFNYPMHPYTKSLISAIPIPDPKLEKNKELFTYDPSIHDYSEDKPEMVDIGNNHFVYGNKKEIEEYKALRAKNVPIKSITIRDENEPPKQTPKKEASPEEIHMAPARDTGSFWYNFLGFLLPLLSLLGAHIFRTHNYIRNYKALKKGAIVGLVFRAVLIGIFALLLVLAVI